MLEQWLTLVSEKISTKDYHQIPRNDQELEDKLRTLGFSDEQTDAIVSLALDYADVQYHRGRMDMGEEHYLERRKRLKNEFAKVTETFREEYRGTTR